MPPKPTLTATTRTARAFIVIFCDVTDMKSPRDADAKMRRAGRLVEDNNQFFPANGLEARAFVTITQGCAIVRSRTMPQK
jgi:hypothetical protein